MVLRALERAEDNLLCPIKLILILALRLGNVEGKTIDELLVKTQGRRNKTIKWTNEERPLCCAFWSRGSALHPDKPAGNHQLTHTLSTAGLQAGILAKLHAHDLRRGSARDTVNLKAKVRGVATETVAATIGQSKKSHARGVTDKYVGSFRDDVWTKRVHEDFEEPFGTETTDNPFPNV